MNDRLRIAVWHNLPSGGGKRALYDNVKGLVERGHYIESWCPDTADQKFLPLSEIVKEHILPLGKIEPSFYQLVKSEKEVLELLRQMEEQCRSCAGEINRGGFDILFVSPCMFFRTTPIAKYVDIPSVIYLHEPYRWFYEALPSLAWLPAVLEDVSFIRKMVRGIISSFKFDGIKRQALAELDNARSFDKILANSVYSRESILRAYNLESSVCYLGVDTELYKSTGEQKENFVVGLGTIYHAKGVDRAIRAVGTIAKDIRPDLIWVGNGAFETELQEYQRLSQELGVNFITKIHIADNEVISLLSRAAAMIYTSRLEPFGYAPLEANACGTAVVGIAEGGVKETVCHGTNGFLAPDNDPEKMGEYLSRLVSSREYATEMGTKAREHVVKCWGLEKGTDNIETVLLSMVGKNSD